MLRVISKMSMQLEPPFIHQVGTEKLSTSVHDGFFARLGSCNDTFENLTIQTIHCYV